MTQSILIIDDEADIRDMLSGIFEDEGYDVLKAAHSEQALALIKQKDVDLIVLDIWLDNSDMDGVQILKHLKASPQKTIPIIMISGHGNVEMAVNTMKMGAFDFIEKPFKIDHILLTVNRALEQKILQDENHRLKETNQSASIDHHYKSPAMNALIKSIEDNAESDSRVMLVGEKGCGKTRIANMIFENSHRRFQPFETIHAMTLTAKDLDESIVKCGKGTLVIESIEKMSPQTQSHLSSLLNSNLCPCRLITTCSPDIKQLLNDNKFSSSLFDRLSITKHKIPSLSERKEDIGILVQEFIKSLCHEFNETPFTLSKDIVDSLRLREWPGNVRQLKIAVEWIVMSYLNTSTPSFTLSDIEQLGVVTQAPPDDNITHLNSTISPTVAGNLFNLTLKEAREAFEKQYLAHILAQYEGNIARMADHIDMERTALYRKLKSLNITYSSEPMAKVQQS